jgi:hypothetical protein
MTKRDWSFYGPILAVAVTALVFVVWRFAIDLREDLDSFWRLF